MMIDVDDLEAALNEAPGDDIVVSREQMTAIVTTLRAGETALQAVGWIAQRSARS